MIAHVISGWSETVDDGSPIWTIADRLQSLAGVGAVRRYPWTQPPALAAAPAGKVLVVTYSYGGADLFKSLARDPRPIDFLVGIVNVNRVADGQAWEECWRIPDCVARALMICTVYRGAVAGRMPVIPECCPIRNESPTRRNCNVFWEGVDHSNVVRLPIVMESVLDAAASLIAEENGSANPLTGVVP